MKKSVLLLFVSSLFLLLHQAAAQLPNPLFVPLEMQQAYAKGTRSRDGRPGPRYWQNRSEYTISAELQPGTRQLNGDETVAYTNNSPDTLTQLVIRLYPDIFKKGAARDEDVDPGDITNGVAISRLQVNGVTISTGGPAVRRTSTNLIVRLPQPLLPRTQLTLGVRWSYTLPAKTNIREGSYGENTFMVAYWYPQIAVYDDVDGWDTHEYGGQTEFYNDFSHFDVTVTVPAPFLVWGTGVWQNPGQVLTPAYLGRYQAAAQSTEITRLVTADDWRKGGITQAKPKLAYRFKAENVPDFVFATSRRYLWDVASVVPEAGRRTTLNVAYDAASRDFYEVARFARQSVEYFSTQLPGVPYPYPSLTVFNGSGGMEFPMFVNDGSFGLEEAAEVAAHEIAHTYFPFYMGINERKYAWMDEGWAQFLPNGIPFEINGRKVYPQQSNAFAYSQLSGREMDMPMMIPSLLLDDVWAYNFTSYYRAGLAYAALQEVLGQDRFKQALHEYMRRWNGKHPSPYDFFHTFNDAASEDLAWFWKPWFFDRGSADLGIAAVETGKTTRITVRQNGLLPLPVHLTVTFADGTEEVVRESARVWQAGNRETVVTRTFPKAVRRVLLGAADIPEVNLQDNVFVVK